MDNLVEDAWLSFIAHVDSGGPVGVARCKDDKNGGAVFTLQLDADFLEMWSRRPTAALCQRTLEAAAKAAREMRMPAGYREHHEIGERDGYCRAIDDIETAILALGKGDPAT